MSFKVKHHATRKQLSRALAVATRSSAQSPALSVPLHQYQALEDENKRLRQQLRSAVACSIATAFPTFGSPENSAGASVRKIQPHNGIDIHKRIGELMNSPEPRDRAEAALTQHMVNTLRCREHGWSLQDQTISDWITNVLHDIWTGNLHDPIFSLKVKSYASSTELQARLTVDAYVRSYQLVHGGDDLSVASTCAKALDAELKKVGINLEDIAQPAKTGRPKKVSNAEHQPEKHPRAPTSSDGKLRHALADRFSRWLKDKTITSITDSPSILVTKRSLDQITLAIQMSTEIVEEGVPPKRLDREETEKMLALLKMDAVRTLRLCSKGKPSPESC
jgi:hypothetical protein